MTATPTDSPVDRLLKQGADALTDTELGCAVVAVGQAMEARASGQGLRPAEERKLLRATRRAQERVGRLITALERLDARRAAIAQELGMVVAPLRELQEDHPGPEWRVLRYANAIRCEIDIAADRTEALLDDLSREVVNLTLERFAIEERCDG